MDHGVDQIWHYSCLLKKLLKMKEIAVFNYGDMIRDFTYIDDIVESINKLIFKVPKKNNEFDFTNPNSSESWAPYKVFNIGNSSPINLMEYINEIELNLQKKHLKIFFLYNQVMLGKHPQIRIY